MDVDKEYSELCLEHAKSLYEFSDSTRSDSGYTAANGFYNSWSGFYDELSWAGCWLYLATDDSKYLVMVTEKGLIKRIKLNAYNVNRKDGIRAITLNDDDKLSWVKMTDGSSDVLIATKNGVAIRFDENDVRPTGRASRGVKALELLNDDFVVGMAVADEESVLLTVSETGFGRISNASDYRIQSRGGKGLINYHTEKYGCVAGISTVDTDKDDIILISSDGIIIRIKADSVNVYSRHSKGVTVMRMNGDAKVVTLAVAPHVDDDTDTIPSENVENTETTESESE